MKLILFSDLHLHAYRDFSRALSNGRNSRLQHGLDVLDRIRAEASHLGISNVLFGGDLWHKKGQMAVSTYQPTYDAIAAFREDGINLVIVVGNHDQATLDGTLNAAHGLSDCCTVVEEPKTLVLEQGNEQCAVRCVPYIEDYAAFKAALKPDSKHVRLLLAHGAINGAVTGPVEYQPEHPLEVDDLPTSYEFRFFGHYHRRQKMAEKTWYIGSPMQHTRGECNELEKGFLVYDTETRKFKNHPLGMPEFKSFDFALTPPQKKDVEGHFIDVEVDPDNYDLQEVAESILKMGAEAVNPIPVFKEKSAVEKRLDVDPGMSPKKLVEKYVAEYAPDDLDERDLLKRAQAYLEGV